MFKKKENYDDPQHERERMEDAKRRMDLAFLPHDSDGNLVPIIPSGPGPVKGFEDKKIFYPHVKPNSERLIPGVMYEADFADGKIPDYLEYVEGGECVGCPYDGYNMSNIVYKEPRFNLPYHEQRLLQQAQAAAPSPPPVLPSDIPSRMPPFAPPVCVQPYDGVMLAKTDETAELLSNFTVHATERQIHKKRGEPDQEIFVLEVVCTGKSDTLVVNAMDLDRVVQQISRKFPACHTNEDAAKASARIANYIRDQIPHLRTVTTICSPGFFQIDGKWVYAHDTATSTDPAVVFKTGCTIPCDRSITPSQALGHIWGFLKLSKSSPVMLPMLLTAHLGLLYELFQEAGHPPRFITFVDGPTGSLKTATALCVFRLTKEQPLTPEASFRDTQAGLERKIGDTPSRVLLVDDFQPAVTAAAGRANLEKLEFLIRLFGDGVAKSRCTADMGRAKEFHPAGCCVVTGEDIGGSHSSLLRCLILPVAKGEIDGQLLTVYQNHPEYLYTHSWHFLNWCGEKGDKIIEFVRQEFQRERQYFSTHIKEPRQADIGAILMLVAEIFLQYAQAVIPSKRDQFMDICQTWRQAIVEILQCGEIQNQELDPIDMYLTALFDLEAAGKVWIAPDQASFKTGHHVGFVKDDAWWLLPSEVFPKVVRYWKEQGVVFPLKPGKVHALLAGKHLIRTTQENRQGKPKQMHVLKSTLEGRPRMLVLYADQAREYLDHKTN